MKRLLLAGAVMMGMSANVQAQPFTQNFNAGIPPTWPMIKADNHIPSSSLVGAIVTKLSNQAWMSWSKGSGDSCAITTSWFTSPAKADRWLLTPSFQVNDPNMVLSWEDYATDGSFADSIQVMIATNAGTTTADFTTTLYHAKGTLDGFSKKGVSLGAYNGQTVRIAFRNNSTDKAVLMLDNVAAAVLPALDGAIEDVAFPRIAASGAVVKVLVSNQGATALTSMTLTYSIDGGTPVSQTFTGLNLLPYAETWLQFTTGVTAAQGPHTLAVNLTQVNSAADPVTSNNSSTFSFTVPGAAVDRTAIIEEFTSSTCAPCASFNVWYDPMIENATNRANEPNSRFTIVKYQMNWPAPGNDASYNSDGLARRNVYGVSGIPDHYTNGSAGIPLGSPQANYQTEITNAKTAPAYLAMSGSYVVNGNQVTATVTITPNFTLSGADYKLYLAATEREYTNPNATTSQSRYIHVMRKMLPNASGITISSFTAGVPQTFTETFTWASGNVQQMNYNFWTHPINGSLVAFVQSASAKDILQSVAIPAKWPTAVGSVASGLNHVDLYPNPARTHTNLVFSLDEAASVSINVVDALGKVVYTKSEKMNSGKQSLIIATDNFAAGIYNVSIATEKGVETQRLTVAK